MQPLGDNLKATVEQAQEDNLATSETTDTTPVKSNPGGSIAPRSSFSIPYATLVPLAKVQKLEAQMVTLLHHIQPWIQRSIANVEERIEIKMAQHTKRKIMEVHQHLDAFELRVLAQPAPIVDVTTLQDAMESLKPTWTLYWRLGCLSLRLLLHRLLRTR